MFCVFNLKDFGHFYTSDFLAFILMVQIFCRFGRMAVFSAG